MERNTISRQEIYDLVWKESLTSISKRLNIPYTHLQKVCRELSIPVPPAGYWLRKKYGKTDDAIPLPSDYFGVEEIKLYPVINDWGTPKELTFHSRFPVSVDNPDVPFPYIVSKRLTDPDPLVLSAQKELERRYSDHYHHSDMIKSYGVINIRVSQKNVARALRFMDAVIKMIRARGHVIDARWSQGFDINGERYELKLVEISEKGELDKLGLPIFKSTGVLSFSIDCIHTRTWKDGRVPIEERLPDILAKLEAIIDWWKEFRGKQAEEGRLREEKEHLIREEKERIQKEKDAFKDLLRQAKRCQRAYFMRQYIQAVEDRAMEKGRISREVQEWVKWARDKVNHYDPIFE